MAFDYHAGKRIRENYKIKGTRKYLANTLTASRRDYPQGTGSIYVPIDTLMSLKKKLVAENPNVSMTSLFTKLLAEALRKHPLLNSALIDNDEFFIYDSVNVGVGVGLNEGIMVVVIKEAQDKSIFEISDELQESIALLKSKKLPMDRMMGSTVTLSNMGMLTVEQFTPFITAPESLILGVGSTNKRAWVNDDGSITARPVCCLNITINHAAFDGLHSGLFLGTMKELMSEPEMYMGI